MGLWQFFKNLTSKGKSFNVKNIDELKVEADRKAKQAEALHAKLSHLAIKKNTLLEKYGECYELYKDDEIIGYYKNITKLSEVNNFNRSAVYKAFNANRPYKKIYVIDKIKA